MSTLVACPSCAVELEVPPEMNASVVNCPSCGVEFELELEEPQAPVRKRVQREVEEEPEAIPEIPSFPGICIAMSVLIICFEILRLGVGFLLYKSLDHIHLEMLIDPSIKTKIVTAMVIMGFLAVTGLTSSIMVLNRSKAGLLVSKIYIGLVVAGICYSFINFNLKAIIVNSVIAVFLVISVIYYSSWWRQCDNLKKLSRKRSRGQQRRRPAGKLKRRRA